MEVEESCKGFDGGRLDLRRGACAGVRGDQRLSLVGGLCGEHRLGVEVFLEGAILLVFRARQEGSEEAAAKFRVSCFSLYCLVCGALSCKHIAASCTCLATFAFPRI